MSDGRSKPFLSFYEEHSIIPTRLSILDKQLFFQHRDFLLRRLGVTRGHLKGARILEVGPGTGQKAQHLLSLGPSEYIGVEGNPRSVALTRTAIESSVFAGRAEVRFCDFLEYEDESRYDLIIAESVVPTQLDPTRFLRQLASLLVPGGVLVFTCMDPVSLLPEMLRRAIVQDSSMITGDLAADAGEVAHFFASDFKALPGMTRVHTDWVIDQLLHPWSAPPLDIPTALASLGDRVHVLSTTPNLTVDLRWYKDPDVVKPPLNAWAIDSFWKTCHNLIDARLSLGERSADLNSKLYGEAEALYRLIMTSEWSRGVRQSVAQRMRNLMALLPEDADKTREAVDAFIAFWDSGNASDLEPFRSWWGRGQQYVSVVSSMES